MSFSLTILGSSSALPTSERFPSAHVLNVCEQFFLIDCGEGTQIQIRRNKIRLGKIDHIFISHLHGDHTFGLFGLISTFNLLGRASDLHIYAHKNIQSILHYHFKFFDNHLQFTIVFHFLQEDREEVIYEDKNITVTSFPLQHRIPSCGFLFKEKPRLRNLKKGVVETFKIPIKAIIDIKNGLDLVLENGQVIKNETLTLPPYCPRSFAYCSDTRYTESILPFINGVDILYHEATYMGDMKERAVETFHTTAAQAGRLAAKANVKKLLLGHFSARYKNLAPLLDEARKEFENAFLVKDGEVFSVELSREGEMAKG